MMNKLKQKPRKAYGGFSKVHSKSKMVVFMKDGSILTRYSFLANDKVSKRKGIDKLEILLYSPAYREVGGGFKWKTAIIYCNETLRGPALQKYVDGKIVAAN